MPTRIRFIQKISATGCAARCQRAASIAGAGRDVAAGAARAGASRRPKRGRYRSPAESRYTYAAVPLAGKAVSMLRYGLRRIAGILPTLLVIITASFFIIRLAPGGPFQQEQTLPPAVRVNLDRAYGLDQPLPLQYLRYLRGLAHGDFGPSFKLRDFTVAELIAQGLPVSAALGLSAMLLSIFVGVPLGAAAALRRHRPADHTVTGFTVVAMALPAFVVGPLLALIFGVYLHWLPVAGWESPFPRYLVLPAVTLALPVIAYIARLTRASLLEVLRANFVRTARARGLGPWRVLWRHALAPTLLPVVSYLGPAIA